MKFSFEAGGYRKNLAEELKTERSVDKAEATKLLEQERSTLQYQVSADIKEVLRKIKEKRGESVEEESQVAPEKISTEIMKMEGSDGVEHELEISTIDISDQIPDEIKLAYDICRLAVLDSTFKHLDLGSGALTDILTQHTEMGGRPLRKIQSIHHSFPFIMGAYIESKRSDKEISKRGMRDEDEMYDSYVELKKRYEEFLNQITGGAFLDDKVFAHVVGAEENAQKDSEKLSRLKKMWPNEQRDGAVTEEAFDIHVVASKELWVNAGGVCYDNFFRPTILLDSRNIRLRTEIKSLGLYLGLNRSENSYLEKIKIERLTDKLPSTFEERIDAAIMKAGEKDQGGVCLYFKRDEPWLYIADWMIDAYHGRLYKITEKPPQEKID